MVMQEKTESKKTAVTLLWKRAVPAFVWWNWKETRKP
jgi:hypothetical protein